MSRLKRRVEALQRRQRQPDPNSALKLLTTDELRRALALIERGGIAVVQDPHDALHPSMPTRAMTYVPVDHALPATALGPLLVRLVQEAAADVPPVSEEMAIETQIALQENAFDQGLRRVGQLSPYTCPPVMACCSSSKPDGACAFAVIPGIPFPSGVCSRP